MNNDGINQRGYRQCTLYIAVSPLICQECCRDFAFKKKDTSFTNSLCGKPERTIRNKKCVLEPLLFRGQLDSNFPCLQIRFYHRRYERWHVGNGEWAFFPRDQKDKQQVQNNIRRQTEFNSKSLSDKDIQLMTLSLNSS